MAGAYGWSAYPLDVVRTTVVEYQVLLHAVRYTTDAGWHGVEVRGASKLTGE